MNPIIPDKIIKFLNINQLATVCFVDENYKPYCINCFFVFDNNSKCLIMKSANGNRHQSLSIESNDISGTILPKTMEFLKLKGVQFTGKIVGESEIETNEMGKKYLKKFPLSAAMSGYIWAVKLEFIKLTENTLGIGHKTIWIA